jgi:hypothetical protein
MNGACVNGQGRPRRYPPAQMTSRGVSFDSSYDALHARQQRLEKMGAADLGTHTGRAGGGDYQSRAVGMGYLAARGLSLRAVIDRNREAWDAEALPVDPAERDVEIRARRFLRERGQS